MRRSDVDHSGVEIRLFSCRISRRKPLLAVVFSANIQGESGI